jgi:predicted enzyme related to lactoylglutathione lyase
MELVQVRLLVDDFGKVFRFYRDVMGLKPQVNDDAGPYGKLSLPSGNAAIALQSRAHLKQTLPALRDAAQERDAALIALRVANLAETVAELRARGASLLGEPQNAWGRMLIAYVRDPEQNLIELQEWLASPAS